MMRARSAGGVTGHCGRCERLLLRGLQRFVHRRGLAVQVLLPQP